jgi:NAD(P)-dependent dehydrogenase (short-subunit alcohol dehydrogenase family)
MRLAGKVAVVTGAGRGIGRAIALAYASEGARVALAARSEESLREVAEAIAASGGAAIPVVTDLRVAEQVEQLAATVEAELGPVDVLVNNSGIAGPTAVLWKIEPAQWEETLQVNLTGVYLCCRAFLADMVSRRSGSIVVVGSMTGKRPLYGRTPYAASKAGLIGLVRTLALEAGEHDIRVNLISPGAVAGPRIESVIEAQAQARGTSIEIARQAFLAGSPLRRLVEAEHVARAAVFLASDESVSITGEDLNVSAGLAMY